MLRLRATLDRLAETAPWSVLTLSLDDELLVGSLPAEGVPAEGGTTEGGTAEDGIDRDRIADVAMLAAVDAWRHMHTYGFVPGATAAGGRLRTMFDGQGDPRPPTVAKDRRSRPAVDGRRGDRLRPGAGAASVHLVVTRSPPTRPSATGMTRPPGRTPRLRRPQQAAYRFPDVRVVEQVEMMHSAQAPGLVDGEGDVLAPTVPSVRAGRLDEQVAHHGPERAFRIRADGGTNGVVAGAGKQRHIATVIVRATVRIAGRPII